MNPETLNDRLSRISTLWSVVVQAHHGPTPAVAAAQQALVQRYLPAIYRYLLGALRDPDAADEVTQEFALRLVRGDFRRADPKRGRFRDYVKTSLSHLITDYRRRQAKQARPLIDSAAVPAAPAEAAESDQAFIERWREELLNRTWEALEEADRRPGQSFYAVLRLRSERPELSSAQMAQELGGRLGKAVSDAWVRQNLHRARERFADLLVEEVARSLQTDHADRVEQELIDLELLPYCRSAVQRYAQKDQGKA